MPLVDLVDNQAVASFWSVTNVPVFGLPSSLEMAMFLSIPKSETEPPHYAGFDIRRISGLLEVLFLNSLTAIGLGVLDGQLTQ